MKIWTRYNGEFRSFEEDVDKLFDDFFENIKYLIKTTKNRNDYLAEENRKLKDEAYKDNEIIKLKEENEKLWKENRRGFSISEEEQNLIDKWRENHNAEKHKSKGAGAIGGRFSFVFTPTSIGTVGKIKCSCGEEYVFKDLM